MKIIFTVYTYYPMKDGVSSVTTYLAEGLAKRGHDVTVVTPAYGNKQEETHNLVKIKRVEVYNIHTIYKGDRQAYRLLIKDLTKDADTLICVCTQTPTTEFLFPVLEEIKCKKILYMHGMLDFRWSREDFASLSIFAHKSWNRIRYGISYALNRKYFYKFAHVIQLYKEDYATEFFEKKYGIECEIVGNAAEEVFFERDTLECANPYAICVSNYLEGKNQEKLIRAIYQTKDDTLKLILIGSENTPYLEKLQKLNQCLAEKCGNDRTRFLINIPRDKTVEYIKNATLYLFGSKEEKFPMAIAEAVAAGVPYISTNVGCVSSLPGGVIIETEDEMASWIDKLMADEDLRRKYSENGMSYAKENLTIASKVKQLEELIWRE